VVRDFLDKYGGNELILIQFNRNKLEKGALVKEIIFILEEDPEGGFTARSLGFSIFTQGNTIDEMKEKIRDAIRCHFEKEEDIPKVIRLHQVKEEVFTYA
jgi:predicted RNase H-like HicB family nuclease